MQSLKIPFPFQKNKHFEFEFSKNLKKYQFYPIYELLKKKMLEIKHKFYAIKAL